MILARVIFGCCALALLLGAEPARAQVPPRTFQLEVNHEDASCPNESAVHDAIAAAARVDPIDPHAKAKVIFTLAQAGAVSRGRWEAVDEHGAKLRERALTVAGSCKKLLAELVLTWALFYETPPAVPAKECPPPPPPVCDAACKDKVREEVRRELLAAG